MSAVRETGRRLARPQRISWSATTEEKAMTLPGDDLVPAPMMQATHAVGRVQDPV
jgi:hypothetical protein